MEASCAWLADHAAEPDAVRAFCQAHGITRQAEAAVRLARQHFPAATGIALAVAWDTDSDEAWLEVNVETPGSVSDVLACYRRCTEAYVDVAPADAMALIRLTFAIQ